METESFKATLQFARMAMWMIFIDCLYRGIGGGVGFIVLCAAFSYAAQMVYTSQGTISEEKHPGGNKKVGLLGLALHLLAFIFGSIAFVFMVMTPTVV